MQVNLNLSKTSQSLIYLNIYPKFLNLTLALYLHFRNKKRPASRSLIFWGGRIRTSECLDQNQVPYHLATPHQASIIIQYKIFLSSKNYNSICLFDVTLTIASISSFTKSSMYSCVVIPLITTSAISIVGRIYLKAV